MALLVCDDSEWVGKASSVARQVSRRGEGHHHDLSAELFDLRESLAHGGDVCLARQSSEVTMKDQKGGGRERVGRPRTTFMVDEFESRHWVADLHVLSQLSTNGDS